MGGIGIYAAYQPIIAYAQIPIEDVDHRKPVATITSSESSPIQGVFIWLTIDWSENITGFSKSDIKTSANTDTFFSTDSQTWMVRVWITHMNEGENTITIPANSVHDNAGNGNEAASISFFVDRHPPSINIDHFEHTEGTVGFIVSFSEPVTGFTQSDWKIFPSYVQDLYTIILWQEYHDPQGYGVHVKNTSDDNASWRAGVVIKQDAFHDMAGTGNDPHHYTCHARHGSEWAVDCSWQY